MAGSSAKSSKRAAVGSIVLALVALVGCDYVEPDPTPPRGDEWVVEAIRRAESGVSGHCRNRRRFYRDRDGDGFGDSKDWVEGCLPPAGYVQNNEDCYDQNPNVYPGQTESFARDRGDGSFDYDCDGRQSRRMTNRAYCIEREDGTGCRSASGWLERKIPACGHPGRWKWYECVTILYRPQPEQSQPGGAGPSAGAAGGTSGTKAVTGLQGRAVPASAGSPAGGTRRQGPVTTGQTATAEFKKRFVCKGRELPWKKRQLCR